MFERICWVSCTLEAENVYLSMLITKKRVSYCQSNIHVVLSVLLFYTVLWQLSSAHLEQISTHPKLWFFSIKEKIKYMLASLHSARRFTSLLDPTSSMPPFKSCSAATYIPAYTIQPPPFWQTQFVVSLWELQIFAQVAHGNIYFTVQTARQINFDCSE